MKSSIIVMILLAIASILLWGSVMGGICLLCLVIGGLRLAYNWFKDNEDFDCCDKD